MKHFIPVISLLSLATTLYAAPPATQTAATTRPVLIDGHVPFVGHLLHHFDQWDTNHDGVLSPDEIARAVADPTVKAQAAAVAATIELMERRKNTVLPPLTKEYFLKYDATAQARTHPVDEKDAINRTTDTVGAGANSSTTQPASTQPADWSVYYVASRRRITLGTASDFNSQFDLEKLRQGPLGDCFFVANVGAMMVQRPEELHKLISRDADGAYVVTLPTTQPIHVAPPTDAELALSSTSSGEGAWMAALEQGYGRFRSTLKGGSADIDGTDAIRSGGDTGVTLTQITGHSRRRFHFGRSIPERDLKAGAILPDLRKQMTAALAEHRMVLAGVEPTIPAATTQPGKAYEIPTPPGITTHHAYAILSYDSQTDQVEMWNPHGQHFTPKGDAGLQNGYPTDHGRFKLPLTEAYHFLSSIYIEQATAATKPAQQVTAMQP